MSYCTEISRLLGRFLLFYKKFIDFMKIFHFMLAECEEVW